MDDEAEIRSDITAERDQMLQYAASGALGLLTNVICEMATSEAAAMKGVDAASNKLRALVRAQYAETIEATAATSGAVH